MNITKKILIFYFILLVCFVISSAGFYILSPIVGKIYFSFSVFIIPLITVYDLYKSIEREL